MKKQIGITGQTGFIGSHLANLLRMRSDQIELIPFNKISFKDKSELRKFASQCDTIVHLAGINRGNVDSTQKGDLLCSLTTIS